MDPLVVDSAFAVAAVAAAASEDVERGRAAPSGRLLMLPLVADSCLPLGSGTPFPCRLAVEQALLAVGAAYTLAGRFFAAESLRGLLYAW